VIATAPSGWRRTSVPAADRFGKFSIHPPKPAAGESRLRCRARVRG
jgi:hypothetical protein